MPEKAMTHKRMTGQTMKNALMMIGTFGVLVAGAACSRGNANEASEAAAGTSVSATSTVAENSASDDSKDTKGQDAMSAHDFSFNAIDGESLPMSEFAGKAVLVVNTASRCGYTPQYDGLQALYEKYQEQGLVVLGVPSNDFGGQEPGVEEDIKKFCETNFNVRFPLTEKTVVKGEGAHPFYKWAVSTLGDQNAPKWNFHKFLVDKEGALVGAFTSNVEPLSGELTSAVERAL
ncbi:MAG: glutathione peroxidase [Pseudomonadota bacterium]